MKTKRAFLREQMSRRTAAIIIATVYIAGAVLGAVIIWGIPFFKHKADLVQLVSDRLEYTLYEYVSYPDPTFGTEYYVYDSQYRVIMEETHFLSQTGRRALTDYLPELFEKGAIFKPAMLTMGGNTEQTVLGIVTGVTMEGPSGRMFAALLLRDFPDLGTTIEIFLVIYTLMFAAAVILILSITKQHTELNNLRRDLVANVGHELKTPITSIRAMAEIIHDGLDKDVEQRVKYSAAILRETDDLEGLVTEILELSRLQSRKVDFKKSKCYADGLFPPVIDRYMMMCGDMGITLDVQGMDLSAIPPLYTDGKHIVTMLNILLDNAIKFTGAGGTIWLSQELHSRYVTICVRDNGPGIEEKDLSHVFDRFYKADVTHNSQGSGLGLSIASETARGLDERLWVQSKWGVGTSFFFTIGYK